MTPPPSHSSSASTEIESLHAAFQELYEVIAKLRSPEGCPWDRAQTLRSIKPYTLEETYELLEAIDADHNEAIQEELGDVLLQVMLDAQIASDEGRFTLRDVIRQITEKMITRHPHVFGEEQAETHEDVRRHWDRAKRSEKAERASLLDGIPISLPSLARAVRLSKKAAQVGFDWPNRDMLFDKLREETEELQAELYPDGPPSEIRARVDTEVCADEPIEDAERKSRAEGEIGDLLFVIANIARRWGINPEEALRRTNNKFARRFRTIEKKLQESGREIRQASLQEMEEIYQQSKRQEQVE